MKQIVVTGIALILIILFSACLHKPAASDDRQVLDSLTALVGQLRPGLGEYMMQIKYHHDELGKAIARRDYERAGYENDEIREQTDKIQQLHITNDKLKEPFVVFFQKYLQAPLSQIGEAALRKDDRALQSNYTALTTNCNSCHQQNNMAFMKID